ncbi:uncharacterized protein BBA_09577 [Beauveria bassiana ARSEF 2860]|uniref:Uncharacterized protein n=1 Tax=Beauveria bassiana (strain ARSEF 2860) TaxID=655819 RepID=J5J475_BEAB2|nr:uncharacterized protein BBA_09577 [Beauveria bassiana ARSEF 2860]EJP61498.1 hypothetical protein BBA_09577 [Beauveria bassiana ARSEF 2860]
MSRDPDLPETVAQLVTPQGLRVLSNLGKLGSLCQQMEQRGAGCIQGRQRSCPICLPESSKSQKVDLDMIAHLRESFPRLRTASESSLCDLPAGRFLLALAKLIRSDVRDPMREYPAREGAGDKPADPGFVPSTTIPFPESSSPAGASPSEYCGSHASVTLDDDQNESRVRKPELLVAELAKELFYLSLYLVLKQSHPEEEFCFRPESHSSTALIALQAFVGADDGDLCKKSLESGSWIVVHPSLMVGECKPASQALFYDNRTERYFPVLTIKAFAQVVGEAVATWKQYNDTELFPAGFGLPSLCRSPLDLGSQLTSPPRVASTHLENNQDVLLSICHILTRLRVEEGEVSDLSEADHEADRQLAATPERTDVSSGSDGFDV